MSPALKKDSQHAILITGCSSGLGASLATSLLADGYFVVTTARDTGDLTDFEGRSNSLCLPLDVTDDSSITRARESVGAAGWRVSTLVNNAGYGYYGPLEETDRQTISRQIDTNVSGVIAMCRTFLPDIRAAAGRIVNISSLVGLVSFPFSGIYAASKFALEAVSDALRMELRPWGIYLVSVNPGPVATRFAGKARGPGLSVLSADSLYRDYYQKALGRMGQGQHDPAEVAAGQRRATRVLRRAVLSRRPRRRYYITAFARLMVFLRRWLPQSWFEALVAGQMGLRWGRGRSN